MLLGIDFSAHHASVILANPDGQAELALRSDLPRDAGSPVIWNAAMSTVRELLRRAATEPARITSTAVSFPAPLDTRGVVQKDIHNPGWEGIDLVQATRDHLRVGQVVAESRTICQALGEATYGALRPLLDGPPTESAGSSWLFAQIDRAISGAACLHGKIWRGAHLAAIDLGAICIERDGVLCSNGRHGCLEGYCGGEAFIERARSYGIQVATPAEIWQLADGNFAAKSLCDDYISRLAQGLGIAINLIDPARLVLGGFLFDTLGDTLLAPLKLRLRDFCTTRHYQNLQIGVAQLGPDAAAMGAIAVARENNSISVNS